jgi:hypothetical protein
MAWWQHLLVIWVLTNVGLIAVLIANPRGQWVEVSEGAARREAGRANTLTRSMPARPGS